MTTLTKKKLFLISAGVVLLISIPLTLSLIKQQQDPRSSAAGSTTLFFEPSSTASGPIVASVGGQLSLDMYVDPGSNQVTFLRYQVTYDSSKLELDSAKPFTLNDSVFTNVEGPVVQNGTVAQSLSIGSDPTKAVQTKTKIGTLHFKPISASSQSATTISFGSLTQALSSAPNDQASQNVLSSTTPAYVTITGSGGGGPTIPPVPTVTGTAVSFTLLLHGVGSAGDNPNPNGSTMSNKEPLHPQRNLQVEVYDTNNAIIASSSAPVTYDKGSGTFIGAVGLGNNIQSGNYNIKIKTDRYLRRLIPGIQQIQKDQTTQLAATQMVAGDNNGDNILNVLDYNAMLDCGYGVLSPLPIADANSVASSADCKVHTPVDNVDLDDNGYINSFDYNLFLRELSVQNGD